MPQIQLSRKAPFQRLISAGMVFGSRWDGVALILASPPSVAVRRTGVASLAHARWSVLTGNALMDCPTKPGTDEKAAPRALVIARSQRVWLELASSPANSATD
jgi:hypothetical protein